MTKDPSKKKPGSRRYREALRNPRIGKVRNPDGSHALTGEVGIDFVCEICGDVIGQYRMVTHPDMAQVLTSLPLPSGERPDEIDRPSGQGKGLLLCLRCNRDTQYTEAKLEAALNGVWDLGKRAPNYQRVVTYRV